MCPLSLCFGLSTLKNSPVQRHCSTLLSSLFTVLTLPNNILVVDILAYFGCIVAHTSTPGYLAPFVTHYIPSLTFSNHRHPTSPTTTTFNGGLRKVPRPQQMPILEEYQTRTNSCSQQQPYVFWCSLHLQSKLQCCVKNILCDLSFTNFRHSTSQLWISEPPGCFQGCNLLIAMASHFMCTSRVQWLIFAGCWLPSVFCGAYP